MRGHSEASWREWKLRVRPLRKENKDESQDQKGSLPCLTSQMGTLKFRPVDEHPPLPFLSKIFFREVLS